jgi:hypothetical protein
MEPILSFKTAMTIALQEYREARAEVMNSITNGTAFGELWRQKQLRLDRALDVWGGLPRKYYGEI